MAKTGILSVIFLSLWIGTPNSQASERVSLNQVLEWARNNSVVAQEMNYRLRMAEIAVEAQKMDWVPQLSAQGGVSRVLNGSSSQLIVQPGDTLTNTEGFIAAGSLRLNLNLYRGGGDLAKGRELRSRVEYLRRLSSAEKQERELQAIELYFEMATHEKIKALNEEAADSFLKDKPKIDSTFRQGGMSSDSHEIFEQQLFLMRTQVMGYDVNSAKQLSSLSNITGKYDLNTSELSFGEMEIKNIQTVEELVGKNSDRRMGSDIFDLILDARKEELFQRGATETANSFPSLSLVGIMNSNQEITAGLRLSFSFLDAIIRNRIALGRVAEELRKDEVVLVNRKREYELRQPKLIQMLQDSQETLNMLVEPMKRAKKNFDLQKKRLRAGMIELHEYLEAHRHLRNLSSIKWQNIGSYLTAVYSLKALGMKVNFKPN